MKQKTRKNENIETHEKPKKNMKRDTGGHQRGNRAQEQQQQEEEQQEDTDPKHTPYTGGICFARRARHARHGTRNAISWLADKSLPNLPMYFFNIVDPPPTSGSHAVCSHSLLFHEFLGTENVIDWGNFARTWDQKESSELTSGRLKLDKDGLVVRCC